MKPLRQVHWWLAFFVTGAWLVFPLFAKDSTEVSTPVKLFSAPTNGLSPPAYRKSPVEFFR